MAFIVIQYLSPDYESLMSELLSKHTAFQISTPKKKTQLKANHIYLISKEKNLICEGDSIIPVEKDRSHNLNLPIDVFFKSLGEEFGKKSIGVVLSGSGTDGSSGIKSIKENRGLVMVQSPESAGFDSMPRSSLRLGIADLIDKPEGLGNIIGKLESQKLSDISLHLENNPAQLQPYFNEILNHLRDLFKIDFFLYRQETLVRRIQNRLQISNCNNLKEYYTKVKSENDEANRLFHDFLIGITKFFRDKKAWEKLNNEVVINLVKKAEPYGSLKIWSVGCSTGEEAYSIAILLENEIRKSKKNIAYKVFATDPSKTAINFASKGVYNENIAADLDSKYLFEFFTKKDYSYQIKKNIRDKIVFSQHDALSDPPIIGVDLIICRNMLIYIKPELQKLILNNFQFSLNYNGYLFLGISENISNLEQVFKAINNNHKIFQNILKSKLIPQSKMGKAFFNLESSTSLTNHPAKIEIEISDEKVYQKLILENTKKVNIIISSNFDILYSLGQIENYLSFPEGIMKRYNLLEMMGKKESLLFRNATRKCLKENNKIIYNNFPLSKNKTDLVIEVAFIPIWLEEINKKIVLIEISPSKNENIENAKKYNLSNIDSEQVKLFETEIKELRFELLKSKEELEAANEELQAINEELLGANEELQSSNGELQSVNEELYAVNNEFQLKITELSQLNDDVNNLFQNLDSAIIYLDTDFKIRKLTPKAEELFHFSSKDVGRPISHFKNWLEDDHFTDKLQETLTDLKTIEYQTELKSGVVFLIRIVPYKTSLNNIDGVIISIVDITDVLKTKRQLEIQQNLILEAEKIAKIGAWEYNLKTQKFTLSQLFGKLMNTKISDSLSLEEFTNYFEPSFQKAFTDSIKSIQKSDFDIEVLGNNKNIYRVIGELSTEGKSRIVGIFQDITKEKELTIRYRQILETSLDGFFAVESNTGKIIDANQSFSKLTGYTEQELLNLNVWDIDDLESREKTLSRLAHIKNIGKAQFETKYRKKDGTIYDALVKIRYNELFPEFMTVFCEDITDRKNWGIKLQEKNDELRKINQELDTFVFRTSHDLRAPLASSLGLIELLKLETDKSESVSELVKLQESALNSMDDFIKDILSYSRNIRLEPKTEEIDIDEEVSQALERLSNLKNFSKISKNIIVKCNKTFFSDCFRFKVILNNLLSNAIKFADLSKKVPFLKIQIDCKQNFLELEVSDNGIGIGNEHKEKVFEIFYRATNLVEGTGVGMFIVKDSLDKLKGSISFESDLGEGTKFMIKIPNNKPVATK